MMLGHDLVFYWMNNMIPTSRTQRKQCIKEGAEFVELGLARDHIEL